MTLLKCRTYGLPVLLRVRSVKVDAKTGILLVELGDLLWVVYVRYCERAVCLLFKRRPEVEAFASLQILLGEERRFVSVWLLVGEV